MTAFESPRHHPSGDMLVAYASGAATAPQALMMATHLALCPECRGAVRAAEAIAAELFLEAPAGWAPAIPEPDLDAPDKTAVKTAPVPATWLHVPEPLRSVTPAAATGQGWANLWFGVREFVIDGYGPAARFLWIPAGRRMPRHDHWGEELTMVLTGSYSDKTGVYRPGDLQIGTPGLDHQPMAGRPGPCVCLVVEDSGLRLSGLLGRLANWGRAATPPVTRR